MVTVSFQSVLGGDDELVITVSAAHYETLQDKLAQLKDARDALNVLRDEHREKRRREQEELERLRQIQMAQKLEILRQKKQVIIIEKTCQSRDAQRRLCWIMDSN